MQAGHWLMLNLCTCTGRLCNHIHTCNLMTVFLCSNSVVSGIKNQDHRLKGTELQYSGTSL